MESKDPVYNSPMRLWWFLLFWILLALLSACSRPEQVETGRLPTLLPVTSTVPSTSTPSLPTETAFPTETSKPTFTVVAPISTDNPTPEPAWQLCSPLAEQTIQEIPEIVSDPYNPPPPGKDDRHHGTDLAYYSRKDRKTIEGEIVQAVLPGKVVAVLENRLPYGNMVIIETPRADLPSALVAEFGIAEGESLYHLYAHFRFPPLVEIGQWVECGQALGEVGATGYNIVNAHLHLETRLGPADAEFPDGMAYYDTRSTEQERANYELWRTSGVFRHFDPMDLFAFYLGTE